MLRRNLTRFAFDPADELGAALRWHGRWARTRWCWRARIPTTCARKTASCCLPALADLWTRLREQRQTGVWGEALLTPAQWTISGSARVDHFSNFNAQAVQRAGSAVDAARRSARQCSIRGWGWCGGITPSFSWSASGFRAYRAPTENELYRTGRWEQQMTKPNPNLRSERATGWETGLSGGHSAVRLQPARQLFLDAGEPAHHRADAERDAHFGIAAAGESGPDREPRESRSTTRCGLRRGLPSDGGYQFAMATVTKFAPQPELVGQMDSAGSAKHGDGAGAVHAGALGVLSLQGRDERPAV